MSRRVIALALAVLMAILAAGCGAPKEEEAGHIEDQSDDTLRKTVVYYATEDGYIVPVMRKIQWQEGIGKAALNLLVDNEKNRSDLASSGLIPTIPDTALDLNIKDGVAIVDIGDAAYACEDERAEANMVVSIVNTLCEFETIKSVSIVSKGDTLERLKHGASVAEPITYRDLNAESPPDEDTVAGLELYFGETGLLVPVTRYVSVQPDIKMAVEELIKGPDNEKLKLPFPKGTQVISAELDKNGCAIINFSSEFAGIKHIEGAEERILKALILTVGQFDGVTDMLVQVEGKTYVFSLPGAEIFANEY
ncbi:MAG: GerMN domain-containing protein [Christensenellales bacterium]|jgi:germination protein M